MPTDPAEQGTEPPVSYIANILPGTIIGYKYFTDAEQKSTLSVTVRGRASGSFRIASVCPEVYSEGDVAEETVSCGTIKVNIFTDSWTTLSGSISLPAGRIPLYLVYEGEGRLDMRALSFT